LIAPPNDFVERTKYLWETPNVFGDVSVAFWKASKYFDITPRPDFGEELVFTDCPVTAYKSKYPRLASQAFGFYWIIWPSAATEVSSLVMVLSGLVLYEARNVCATVLSRASSEAAGSVPKTPPPMTGRSKLEQNQDVSCPKARSGIESPEHRVVRWANKKGNSWEPPFG
jgi:hypothetical protein